MGGWVGGVGGRTGGEVLPLEGSEGSVGAVERMVRGLNVPLPLGAVPPAPPAKVGCEEMWPGGGQMAAGGAPGPLLLHPRPVLRRRLEVPPAEALRDGERRVGHPPRPGRRVEPAPAGCGCTHSDGERAPSGESCAGRRAGGGRARLAPPAFASSFSSYGTARYVRGQRAASGCAGSATHHAFWSRSHLRGKGPRQARTDGVRAAREGARAGGRAPRLAPPALASSAALLSFLGTQMYTRCSPGTAPAGDTSRRAGAGAGGSTAARGGAGLLDAGWGGGGRTVGGGGGACAGCGGGA